MFCDRHLQQLIMTIVPNGNLVHLRNLIGGTYSEFSRFLYHSLYYHTIMYFSLDGLRHHRDTLISDSMKTLTFSGLEKPDVFVSFTTYLFHFSSLFYNFYQYGSYSYFYYQFNTPSVQTNNLRDIFVHV